MVVNSLLREKLVQTIDNFQLRALGYHTSCLNQPGFVNGPHLIEQDQSLFTLERALNSGRIAESFGGHWSNNRGLQCGHFIRGNNDAGPCLLDFRTLCRIKLHEPDLKPVNILPYHSQSSSSDNGASNHCFSASLASSVFLVLSNSSFHPSLFFLTGCIKTPSSVTFNSSCLSSNRACSITAFGIRIPCEFPILINVVMFTFIYWLM